MSGIQKKWLLISLLFIMPVSIVFSEEAPEHFYNAPENINSNPDFVPGDYPIPDTHAAKTVYELKKSELAKQEFVEDGHHVFAIGAGEIKFSVVKNETANVIGYFRNYAAVGTIGDEGPTRFDLVIDLNSLDSGVPGRDYRIQSLFFQSAKPESAIALISFDRVNLGGLSRVELEDGNTHQILAQGTLVLNGVSQLISASLNVTKKSGTWAVETISPIQLLISNFGLSDRVIELMKACNHKSIGNAVDVTIKFYLR